MANLTWPEHEWNSVMNQWLESKTTLDPELYLEFSDDEYGLLNAAKFAMLVFIKRNTSSSNNNRTEECSGLFSELEESSDTSDTSSVSNRSSLQNIGHAEVVAKSPSIYNMAEIVILSVIITAMMILIVVGNMLVIIAIATENNLTTVQNWFIASLAVADMMIGLVVMPFSLSYELMRYWMFGDIWCKIWGALDVFLCTSSIMNICLISLDRYWSITKAIQYMTLRTPNRVALMIAGVWILSGLISIPPLMGWSDNVDLSWFWLILSDKGNKTQMDFLQELQESGGIDLQNFTDTLETQVYPQCGLSQDLGYVMYSAFGSFYIPSCIMVFVYIKIYYAARERARRVINKPGLAKRVSRRFTGKSNTAASAANTAASVAAANKKAAAAENISTISSNANGGCNVSVSPNNTTVGISPCGAVPKSIEIEVDVKLKPQKKKARFQNSAESADANHENPPQNGEKEAFLNKNNHEKQSENNEADKQIRPTNETLHNSSSDTANNSRGTMVSTGRPSDPYEEVITITSKSVDHRSHAYGTCATNGGQPRVRCSIGVGTKDDQQKQNGSSENGGDIKKDNGSMGSSNSSDVRCLKLRLRSKFRSAAAQGSGSRSRPSKETREVIDMGKMSAASLTSEAGDHNNSSSSRKGSFPLNGILKKMEKKADQDNTSSSNKKSNTKKEAAGRNNNPGGASAMKAAVSATKTEAANNADQIGGGPKLTHQQLAEKEKKRIARKKERRATLILGLIMGSFIACWFPFFFMYSISPICPICETGQEACCVRGWGFTFAFWLGYSNSALNPVIYTIFNKDFRRAFKRILFK